MPNYEQSDLKDAKKISCAHLCMAMNMHHLQFPVYIHNVYQSGGLFKVTVCSNNFYLLQFILRYFKTIQYVLRM